MGPSDQWLKGGSVADGLEIRDRVPMRFRHPKGSMGTGIPYGVMATMVRVFIGGVVKGHL